MRMTGRLLIGVTAACVAGLAFGAEPWYGILEAEDMNVESGWTVARGREGYFPAYPNGWSANRLKAAVGDAPAVAAGELQVPAAGAYNLWVRYESSYGFDAPFTVEVRQGGTSVWSGAFGDRNDLKYFNGTWRVQGPWLYHSTDYVYQKVSVTLAAGPATLVLRKAPDSTRSAARLLDLFCLTDDLAMEPGGEVQSWNEKGSKPTRPPIQVRCVRPVYVRVQVPASATTSTPVLIYYRCFSPVSGRGPHRLFQVAATETRQRSLSDKKPALEPDESLPAGFDSGWRPLELSTFFPACLRVTASNPVEVAVSLHADGREAAVFKLDGAEPRDIYVATGNSRLEDDVVRGRPAIFFADFLARNVKELDDYKVPGKRAFKFMVSAGGNPLTMDGFDKREFARALGSSGIYFSCPPQYYTPENAKRWGINRGMGYAASSPQSAALERDCYEGDYTRLEKAYQAMMLRFTTNGIGDIPQNIKMIEESGPPALATLRTWPKIAERFRDYAKQQGLAPADLLSRQALREALLAGKTAEADLWPLVTLGEGTPQEAVENPILYYHSKVFGGIVFCDNCAEAVKLVEKTFPKGSVANWGASHAQDGNHVRRRYYDEFMLFRRRGMTAYGSETSWSLCGLPHYIGPQSQAYDATIGRSVARYHNALLGSVHLLASGTYGYNADYVETASYAMAAHGFTALNYYDSAESDTFSVDPEIRKAIKRVSYTLGAVEDRQTESRVAPARVALGWSETTAVWEQAEPVETGYNMPGPVMYALERHYLYLLLRHLQLPLDLVCDADLEDGRLKDYAVYVLVGDHLTAKAAAALREWVEQGGVLVSVAGGGLWDEYNQPLDTLKDVYGVKGGRQYAQEQNQEYIPGQTYPGDPKDNRLEKKAQALRAKLELIHAFPLDEIAAAGSNAPALAAPLPVLGYRQGFKVEAGRTLGTFKNQEAAVVANTFGKGRALIMGFLPGISYLYGAFPKLPYGRGGEDLSLYLYPEGSAAVRAAFGGLLKQVWPEMGAAVTCSNPYVEANLLRQKNGDYHVALVNFSGKPVPELTVRIRAAEAGKARKAKATFGKAVVKAEGDTLVVNLPLEKFEWLTLE